MSKTKIKKLIPIILLMIICGYLISTYYKSPVKTSTQILPINTANNAIQTTLLLRGVKLESSISQKTSVYDFMQKLEQENKITFQAKNYIGMGEFIESINGIKNTNTNNWIYYINNVKANVGVSNYQINPGDVVSWKYEANN